MNAFTNYRRKQIAELRPYEPGEVLSDRVSISPADRDAGSPKLGDMIARNPANHDDQWLVAADYFAVNFEPASQPEIGPNFDFGAAIDHLKAGRKVAREGWNGKGMWLVMVPGTPTAQLREGTPYRDATGLDACEILPHIDMWTTNAHGRRAMLPGWLASQSDMLATDWVLVD